jgi:ABC-type long-subunit fatty acid transport system fused permease/ATPase subunit
MNFSSILNDYVSGPFDKYFEEPASQGCFLVLMEMGLSLIGSILNLIIIIPILEFEELATSTTNVLMANLSLSNLIATVFVKLFGVVYHGYAVAIQR